MKHVQMVTLDRADWTTLKRGETYSLHVGDTEIVLAYDGKRAIVNGNGRRGGFFTKYDPVVKAKVLEALAKDPKASPTAIGRLFKVNAKTVWTWKINQAKKRKKASK